MLRAKAIKPSPIIQETDLREITRYSELCLTVVTVHLDWDRANMVKWLVCGQSRLIPQRERSDGTWRLEAYLTVGVTDFEHDSAYAFKLPLIGVQFDSVSYHQTQLTGWVDPNGGDESFPDFHVPRPGYNPMKLPGAELCDLGEHGYTCYKKPHMIVPEKHFVPPFDAELYEAIKGKKVEILISPVFPKEDKS
jgi:hypothetical protein